VIIRWRQWGDMVYPVTSLALSLTMIIITNRRRTT
jgi:hypothetical protein